MHNCVIYYKEFTGTASEKDCTLSYKLNQTEFKSQKDKMLSDILLNKYQITCDEYTIEKGEHGKPCLASHPEIHYNLSHTISHNEEDKKACIAYALSSTPVGIDAEYIREIKPKVAKKVCSNSEYNNFLQSISPNEYFISLWTLKESYVKYTGEGLRIPLSTLSFSQSSCEDKDFGILRTFLLDGHPELSFYQYELPNHLWISVCLEKDSSVTLKIFK